MEGVQGVYHLAGMISILDGPNPGLRQVNLEGTVNVLREARETGAGRVVYDSSIHAFCPTPPGIEIDESVPFHAGNCMGEYDSSKAAASIKAQEAARLGQDVVLACPTGVVGPYDFRISEFGRVVRAIARGHPMGYIHGAAYDFVDVRDVADGLISAMERGRTGESYLLSGERVSVKEIMLTLRDAAGRKNLLVGLSRRQAELIGRLVPPLYRPFGGKSAITSYSVAVLFSNSYINHEKASRELNYHPRPVKTSLRDAVIWFQEGRLTATSTLQSD
jgi:dihydroflavonol-4-reductase